MVLLTTTPRTLSALSSLSHSDRATLNALPTSAGAPIEHRTIIALSRLSKDFRLNALLRGASVYIPPPPPKPKPSAEFVALMERLRKEQEQREYRLLMTKNAEELNEVEEKDDITPSLVFNILLSIVMCAGSAFYMTRWWRNDGIRVLVSLLVGIVVGVAEVTVYASYLRKVKLSRAKEQSLREKKELIEEDREFEADQMQLGMERSVSEKEAIWGRGINGGMRRRIREKWEKEQELGKDEE